MLSSRSPSFIDISMNIIGCGVGMLITIIKLNRAKV
jgi:hypothetical protein